MAEPPHSFCTHVYSNLDEYRHILCTSPPHRHLHSLLMQQLSTGPQMRKRVGQQYGGNQTDGP